MSKTITIELRLEDAEPILRHAAREAAEFGSLLDYVTRKTGNRRHQGHGESYEDARKRWHQRFVKGKRMVESFEVEYEQVSEGETLTVDYQWVGGTRKIMKIPGIGPVGVTSGSEPDYNHPFPSCRGEIHAEACRRAAERVVCRWRAALSYAKVA